MIDEMKLGNAIHLYHLTVNKINVITDQLNRCEKTLKEREILLFNILTEEMFPIGGIINTGNGFEYKILSVGITAYHPDSTNEFNTFVRAIRVKKGTNAVISGKLNSIAYSELFYTKRIKEVLR